MATAIKEKDLEDIAPLEAPADTTFGEPTADAPYGYKKDGTPAKRRGRPAGYKTGPRTGRRSGSLEKEIGGLIVMVNLPLQMVPALQRDALDHMEIQALSKAIDKQCQISPTFRKYVEQAISVQGGTSLVAIVAMIAARRVVRHDFVPIPEEIGGKDGVDLLIGQAINASSNLSVFAASIPNAPTPTPTEE